MTTLYEVPSQIRDSFVALTAVVGSNADPFAVAAVLCDIIVSAAMSDSFTKSVQTHDGRIITVTWS